MKKRILTVTMNPAIDTSLLTRHVMPEHKLRCLLQGHEPGGGGLNVSRAIRRLGGESRAYYTSGGVYGKMLDNLLKKENIRCCPVAIEGLTRESFIVLEESNGQQYRFSMPGPHLKKKEWVKCLNKIKGMSPQPDYIVVSGSLPPGVPPDFYARIVKIAKRRGSKVIVDTSAQALREARRCGAYLLKPNMRELRDLVGKELKNEAEQEEAAMGIIKGGGSQIIVVSLGAAGALLVTGKGSKRLRAPTVPIKSKVGAGDSMVAGIVLGLGRDKQIEKAVRFGVASGSAAVMTPGTELCRRKDTEELYKQLASQKQGVENYQ